MDTRLSDVIRIVHGDDGAAATVNDVQQRWVLPVVAASAAGLISGSWRSVTGHVLISGAVASCSSTPFDGEVVDQLGCGSGSCNVR